MMPLSHGLSHHRKFSIILMVVLFFVSSFAAKKVFSALTSSPNSPSAASPALAVTTNALLAPPPAALQAVTTVLQLRFEGTTNGEAGSDTPTLSTNVLFQSGINGQAVNIDRNSRLTYNSAANINPREGTIETWLRPSWNGTDTQTRTILQFGTNGGIWFGKEGTNLRFAINRANVDGSLELDVVANIQAWQPSQWHHVAASWSNNGQFLRLYIDGTLVSERLVSATFPNIDTVANPTIQIGSEGIRSPLQALMDEFSISDGVRTSQDIAQRMLQGISHTATGASSSTSIQMYPGWSYWRDITFTANVTVGGVAVPITLPIWAATRNITNPTAIELDEVSGRITAIEGMAPATGTVTATLGAFSQTIDVTVLEPETAPLIQTGAGVPASLSTPMSNAVHTIPVAIIRYFPTTNGTNLDSTVTGITSTLANLETKQLSVERKLKYMLEEGSRFRAYPNPTPPSTAAIPPSLGYKVVKIINVYEEIPPGLPTGTPNQYFPDYKQIFNRFNLKADVEAAVDGVKEVWLEQYVHNGPSVNITLNQSNLSSPLTNDISSSLRTNDDLPAYSKSYTVFGINYALGENHAARHHGLHLEALLTFANIRQDENDELFQDFFLGRDRENDLNLPQRAGRTLRPPNVQNPTNATTASIFSEFTSRESDIQDWSPEESGLRTQVNNSTWFSRDYGWPAGETPEEKNEGQWYIFWMQSIPGLGNTLTRQPSEVLTNWWEFIADWDAATRTKLGLARAIACAYSLNTTNFTISNDGGTGSVNVSAGAGCEWAASSSANWLTITANSTGFGNGTIFFTIAANAGASRTGTITIRSKPGDAVEQIFTVTQATDNPVPTLTSLTPANTIAGSNGFELTLTGTGFAANSVVQVNNVNRTVKSSTTTQIVIDLTAADVATAGNLTIAVTNPAPGGGTASLAFPVNPAPTLTSLNPTSALVGGADFTLIVTGTNFLNTSKVRWGGAERTTTFISATELRATIPATDLTSTGTVNITVNTPTTSGSVTTSALPFAINNPGVVLSSLNPTTVLVGGATFELTLNGSGFLSNSSVQLVRTTPALNVTKIPKSVNQAGTQMVIDVTAAEIAATGAINITITNPAPGGGTSATLALNVNNPAPTLTTLNPTSVIVGGAQFQLIVTGTNFVSTSKVLWAGSERTTTFISATELRATIPATDLASTGTVNVTVNTPTPGGGTSSALPFNINNPAPTISSLSPNTIVEGSGAFTLIVNGTNFVNGAVVSWNGNNRTTVFTNNTQLSANITAADVAAGGNATVTVTNPAPGGGTASTTFNVSTLCGYALNPTTETIGAAGGARSVNVTANAGCAWAATSNAAWIIINPGNGSGTGNGTINYTVQENTGSERTGTLTLQGQTLTVTQSAPQASCVGQRTLPAQYVAGQAQQVTLQITPTAVTQSYAVEETPPAGWTVSGIDNGGQFDALNNKVKWGPFFDATERTLKYSVTPPDGTTGEKTFAGIVSVNGSSQTLCGASSMTAAPLVHPADLNNNYRIEINELTAYGAAWKQGTAWSRPPNPIDINYLTNAGLIWKLGEIYHFDITKSPPFVAGAGISLLQPKMNPAAEQLAASLTEAQAMQLLRASGYMPGLGFGLGAALEAVLTAYASPLTAGTAVASFNAATYAPGVGVTVTITVTPDAGTQVYAAEDTIPMGWTVSGINNSGAFDSANRKVKWGPFFDNTARTFTYIATPPSGETGAKTFAGSVSFDGASVAITGARTLSSAPTCTYSLGTSSQSFNANGGAGSFNVIATAGCAWSASTGTAWISLTQASGSGNGAVNFTVAANAGAARTGTIAVAGQIFSVNQSANAAPTLTPAAALTRQQSATASAVTIATVSDTETAANNLTVTTTSIPNGLSVTDLINTNGTVSALVTASCAATVGSNTIGLRVTDAQGSITNANLTVNVTSNPNCFLQIVDTTGSDLRSGSVLLFSYYTSSLTSAAVENTQIRLTNTHETQETTVRLFFVDGQTADVFSLFVCLQPNETTTLLMSETDPAVTGYIIALAVDKTTGCPTSFNYLMGSAALKLSSGHLANLGAVAVAALTANPAACASGASLTTLNFDGANYGRLPRLLVVDNLGSIRDGNTTRLILTRVGGSLVNGANGLGAITGKVYNASRTAQDFTFSTSAPQSVNNLTANFPRLTTRLDNFITAGQTGWMKMWTDGSWGVIGSVMNLPSNLRTTNAFVGGSNLQQGALAQAVTLEIPVTAPPCQ